MTRPNGKPAVSDRLTNNLRNYQVSPTGCWVWQGYHDKNGYGRVYDPGARRVDWVHRVAYRVRHGSIPPQHEIDHTCTNTRCINPDHLDPVTRAEHVARTMRRLGKDDQHLLAARMRMQGLTYEEIAEALRLSSRSSALAAVQAAIAKGLVAANDVPPAPRLNEAEREEIRELWSLGIPQPILAEFYSVDSSHISRICSGKSSGHAVTGEIS